MKSLGYSYILALIFVLGAPVWGASATTERRISVDEYSDKMQAAWLGKMIGVSWGITTEFRYSHRIVPDSMMKQWSSPMVNEGFNQDDLYLSLLALVLVDRYGFDLDPKVAYVDRLNLQFEYGGRNALASNDGIAPPDLGHPMYKPTSDGCGYTCGADYSGLIAPGLPESAHHFANQLGTAICYGDGLYGGVFVGAMYSEAFFSTDMRHIVETALLSIPEKSLISQAVKDVLVWHKRNPNDWKATWKLIMDKYWWNVENNWIAWPYGGVGKGINLDSKSMAALSVMALLYGNGDFERTVRIAVQGSEDSDCNASIAAGILLCSKGMKIVDEKFYQDLLPDVRFKYFNHTFSQMVELTRKLAIQAANRFGGRVEQSDGQLWIVVPSKTVDRRKDYCYSSKDPHPATGARFTAEQMDDMELLIDPGFENDSPQWSYFSDRVNNHTLPIKSRYKTETFYDNNARTGFGNAMMQVRYKDQYVRANTKIFSGLRQNVVVRPDNSYKLSCFVQTAGGDFSGKAEIRVLDMQGKLISTVGFGNKSDWTKVVLKFNSAQECVVVVEIGFWGANECKMRLRVDDCSLKIER